MHRLLYLIVLFFSCKTNPPCSLRELTHQELYDKAEKAIYLPNDLPIYSLSGAEISRDSIRFYDRHQYTYAQWVDCKDTVVKLVVRPIIPADQVLRARIDSLYHHNLDLTIKRIQWVEKDSIRQQKMIEMAVYNSAPQLYDVDCNHLATLLAEALKKDQNNRANIDLSIDKENLTLVESIVYSCGTNAIEVEGIEAIYSFFMIVQHAPSRYRKKYSDFFKTAASNGLLNKSSLALMIDRTLTDEGKKQLYGSQYRKNRSTGEIELYPIIDRNNIDSIRATMDLQPLNDYLEKIKQL